VRLVDVGEDEGGEKGVTLFERGKKTWAVVTANEARNDIENIPRHKIRPALDSWLSELVGTASDMSHRRECSSRASS
jgi:hypothetical protein